MRAARRVRWYFCVLLVFSAAVHAAPALESSPVYLRLESGTWAVGGVDDLADSERSLTLMPEVCDQRIAVVEVGVGFVIAGDFTELDVAGTVKASQILTIEILFRNPASGKCDSFHLLEGRDSSFLLTDVPVDSAIYKDLTTSEVELCLVVRSACGPPPTDKDAVSVQELSIGSKG